MMQQAEWDNINSYLPREGALSSFCVCVSNDAGIILDDSLFFFLLFLNVS